MEHAGAGAQRGTGPELRLAQPEDGLADLIEQFCATYTNGTTAMRYRRFLQYLFSVTGTSEPSALTASAVIQACDPPGRGLANNTVRNNLGMASRFLTWCERRALVSPLVVEEAVGRTSPLRRVPRTFGKVQATHPGRWLTRDEAAALVASCDDSDLGLRDRIAIRFGLLGMRVTEVGTLTWRNVQLHTDEPVATWMGKADARTHPCSPQL